MTCWVWGNTVNGELGLGGIEEDAVSVSAMENKHVLL